MTICMYSFKMSLYKHQLYQRCKALIEASDAVTILAWRYQQYITKQSHIFNFLQAHTKDLSFVFSEGITAMNSESLSISAIQFKVALYQYGLYDTVDSFLNNKHDITQIIWQHAPTFTIDSDIVLLITEHLTWNNGQPFTDEDMLQLFTNAAKLYI